MNNSTNIYVTAGGTLVNDAFKYSMEYVPTGSTQYQVLSEDKNKFRGSPLLAVGYEYTDDMYIATELQYIFAGNTVESFHSQGAYHITQSLKHGDKISLLFKVGKPIDNFVPHIITGICTQVITQKVVYAEAVASGYNQTFKKRTYGIVLGGGVQYNFNDNAGAYGFNVTWNLGNNNITNYSDPATTAGVAIDAAGYRRIYKAKCSRRPNLGFYVSIKLSQ